MGAMSEKDIPRDLYVSFDRLERVQNYGAGEMLKRESP